MIRIGRHRGNMRLRILLGSILIISGLLSVIDEKYKITLVVANSESFSSGSQFGQGYDSNSGSSVVVGDESENSTVSQESGLSLENSAPIYEDSKSMGSSDPLPEGASLIQGDSSVSFESPYEGLPAAPKSTSPEGVLEYGYNNIQESSVDAKSPDSLRDKSGFSDPVVMESMENIPNKSVQSQAFYENFDGSILEKELNNNMANIKTQEQLLEPLTENVEVSSSHLKTPKTSSFSESGALETHAMHADSHMKSPPKSPDDFVMDDYEIKVDVNPMDQKEVSKDTTGSDVVFEETSESKLPTFLTKEESKIAQPVESSRLTSGISEVSESSGGNLVNIENSSLFSQKDNKESHTEVQEETSLSTDISKSTDFSDKTKMENQQHSFGFIDETKHSGKEDSVVESNAAESSFVNPKTEDLTAVMSETEASEISASNNINNDFREPSKTASISVEPPSPPSSAVEEKTVGNQRFYSGPYIRTSATAGKVSPRIASVIDSLVGQFEKLNLYGAGNKSQQTTTNESNISNKFVSNMKNNFDNAAKDFSDFVPQNTQEEELVKSLKMQPPRNTFLFKNRFEEMKNIQSSSGKTLLQEEIEKLRGTYRSALSKQFSTGKTWERPNISQIEKPIQVTYSGDEFLEKVKQINPNSVPIESHSIQLNEEPEMNKVQASYPEPSENGESAQNTETSRLESPETLINHPIPNSTETITEKTQESEETTNEGYSDAESFSRRLASGSENSVTSSIDESQLNLEPQKPEEASIHLDSPRNDNDSDVLRTNGLGNMPFSYINAVKELPVGLKPQDAPSTEVPEAIKERRMQSDDLEGQIDQSNDIHNKEVSNSNPKDEELSLEQEKEIEICFNKAKKIKTVNFGLNLTEEPNSVVTETFINEFTKYRSKFRELVNFGQETLRVAEKYNKKRSWRKKTRKFKLEFLELSNEFLQHSKAIRSLLYHLIQVTNPNIMEILQQIVTGDHQNKQNLLVQCKILYQAFYSYKNSVRSRLLKKFTDYNFVQVLNNQIKVYLEQRFNPIVKAIQSNKYLKKKLFKQIPDVSVLANINQYQELSQTGGGEQVTPNKKKGNRVSRFFRRLFKKPSCFKYLKSKKQSRRQKSSEKKST